MFVVCPQCDSIYDINLNRLNLIADKARCCEHVEFPNHVHTSKWKRCTTPLFKEIRMRSTKLAPRKTFVYHSVISSLQRFVNRRFFFTKV